MRPISNLNSVSIKNYGPQAETLAIIRELSKLGLIKNKSKPKKERKPQMIEDFKQESDMVGYTKSLGGPSGQFPLRLITSGMTQQQIEDINRSNSANVAALRNEIQQQRFSDIQRIGTAVGQIVNPLMERFRGSTFPAEAQGDQPIDPFATKRPSIIYLGDVQDTQEVPMSRTSNPNAPEFTSEFAESIFPEEESDNIGIPIAPPNLQPRKKIGGGIKKTLILDEQDVANELGLGKIPTMRNSYDDMERFYIFLTDTTGDDRLASANSKSLILADINKILKEQAKKLLKK